MNHMKLFEEAAEAVLSLPEGERNFLAMREYIVDNFILDMGSIGETARNSPLADDQGILEAMIGSGMDFDIYHPMFEGRVSFRLPDHRKEIFSIWAAEHDLLKEELPEKGYEVSLLSGLADRGLVFSARNPEMAFVLKSYQSIHESPVASRFSGTIGPKVYSIGKDTFVEELFRDTQNVKYLQIDSFTHDNGTKVAASLFAYMHKNDVAYHQWNWAMEVRVRVEGDEGRPKIVDFGWAYPKGAEDPHFDRHQQPWQDLVDRDLSNAVNSLSAGYGRRFSEREFMKHYEAFLDL